MKTHTLDQMSICLALVVSICFMGALKPQDKKDERIETTMAELKETILQIPNQERRFKAVSEMVTRSLATSSYGEDLTLVINTAVEILQGSNPPETEAAALFVENDMLSLDCSILGASVVIRLVGDQNYTEICKARWKLINWRNNALNTYANNSGSQELKERRCLRRIDALIKETKDISTKMMLLPLDAEKVTDDAELIQLIGTSQQARDALWYLSMYYTLNEAASELEETVARSKLTAAQEKVRLLKTENTILMASDKMLAEKCARLAEIVRQNHLEGVAFPPLDSKSKLTLTGLQYLTQGWLLCIKDKAEILPENGIEITLNNTEPRESLAILASTPANVDIMITVIDVPTDTDEVTQGSDGWAQLNMDSPSVGEIKVRVFNLGSVPAEIEIKGYYEPRK